MEQEIPQPLISAQSILAELPPEKYDTLCDRSIKKRGRIVDAILTKLQMQEESLRGDTLQSIPLAMLRDGRYMEAANFVGLTIARGGYFDISIVLEVVGNLARSMLISIAEGDNEAAHVLREALYGLWERVLVIEEYEKNPIVYISIGGVFEGEGKNDHAIQAYTKALELGSTDAHICIANLYEKSGRYSESADILKQAYEKTKDDRFLQGYISALSKSGKRHKAYEHYMKLLKKNTKPTLQSHVLESASGLPPFIVFTEEVHSDPDLDEFSDLLIAYHTEGTFLPNPQLRNLAENASIYISNEIEGINKTLGELIMTPREGWTDEQILLHRGLVKRRLYLMQTHIILLQDHRYFDDYLYDMRELAINGNSEDHKILREFFTEYFSQYTQVAYNHVSEDQGGDTENMDIFESLKLHLIHIVAIFSQGTMYEDIRDALEPLIDECLDRSGEGTTVSIEEASGVFHLGEDGGEHIIMTQSDSREDPDMMNLRKESKNYTALSTSTMDMYEKYVGYLDARYGVFYRRSIQQLVRDRAAIPPSIIGGLEASLIKHNGDKECAFMEVMHNMPILLEDPYVALFFFLEKILLGHDILDKGQDIDDWIVKYQLNTLGANDALLLASMLYENAYHEYAIQYVINIPGMLQEPQVLYMIMEHLRYMDEDDTEENAIGEDREVNTVEKLESDTTLDLQNNSGNTEEIGLSGSQGLINVLSSICKRDYDIEDFFEYFDGFMQNVIEDEDATDVDLGYTLLASGNMRCIQDQREDETIAEFVAAGRHGITYGYISAADMLQDMDKHSDALEYFLIAHKQAPSIITIRRLLNLYMETGNLDEAWKLIDSSISEGYDVEGYISAVYLCEGKIREALKKFCKILTSQGDIDSAFPDWYEEEVARRVKTEITSPIASIEDFEINILGSYIFADRMSTDLNDYLNHVRSILKFLDTHKLEDTSTSITKILPLLTGVVAMPSTLSATDLALVYIQLHLERIHGIILDAYKSELLKNDNNMNENGLKILQILNAFIFSAIFVIKYFPDSQKYVTTWQRVINFYATDEYKPSPDEYIHEMPSTVQ